MEGLLTFRQIGSIAFLLDAFASYNEPRSEPRRFLSGGDFGHFKELFLDLLQLRVFRLGSNEDGDVGISIFPEREEILIGSSCLDVVAR